jgi:predicted short-subunit dehydrogenase-like oxidoreductase (DUF2520 family)
MASQIRINRLKKPLNIVLVGAGRVGKCLAPWHRKDKDYVKLIRRCQKLPKISPDVLLFTTGDQDLVEAIKIWAEHLPVKKTRLVAHTSGIKGLEVLAPFSKRGERVAAIHPLFSFPENPQRCKAKRLDKAFVSHLHSKGALPIVKRLISSWSGTPLEITNKKHRELYHAALSMASNQLTALTALTTELLEPFLGNNASKAISSISNQSLKNFAMDGAKKSLTGPIVRGDIDAVKRHWQILPKKAKKIYQSLGFSTIELALASGRINSGQARKLKHILRD